MTVSELINELTKYPDEMLVRFGNANGDYGFKNIKEDEFECCFIELFTSE